MLKNLYPRKILWMHIQVEKMQVDSWKILLCNQMSKKYEEETITRT